MKIKSIFHIIQGHQITDEDIYKSIGNIPIFTSNNVIKGYWDKAIVTQQDLPCITYPTKAFSGETYIQYGMFDANNTAVLIPYLVWRERIILEWVSLKLANIFLEIATSKGGVSYLNKEIVEDYELDIPLKDIQEKELEYYKRIKSIKDSAVGIKTELNKLKKLDLLIEDAPREQIKLSEMLDYTSRNDSLSEEGIYQRSQGLQGARETVRVISGSTDDFYGEIPFDNKLHIVKMKPCLQVITRGNAGQIKFVNRGNYATNTNSMLLTLKEEMKEELNIYNDSQEAEFLKFLGIYLQPIFLEHCSSADLSVFPLTEEVNSIIIPKFTFNQDVMNIIKKYDLIFTYNEKIKELLENISGLQTMQLINE